MKIIIGAAALILLFSVPAHGQAYGGNVGGGGSLNSGASLGSGGGMRGVTFHSIASNPETQLHMTVISGEGNLFIPSTYVPFAKAVEMGRAMEIAKPKPLAEVASEYRNEKKEKGEVAGSRILVEQGSRRER